MLILGIILVVVPLAILEARKAPEGWICHYCHGEVVGAKECPWCGSKKD